MLGTIYLLWFALVHVTFLKRRPLFRPIKLVMGKNISECCLAVDVAIHNLLDSYDEYVQRKVVHRASTCANRKSGHGTS